MTTSSGSLDYGRFDELAEEFAERYRRGERPSVQEYIDRLPEMAEEIREMFPALVEVEQAQDDARGDAPPSAQPRLRQVGDYRILREIGRGGMGVVYEAEQISLGRRVALKVLPSRVSGDRKALMRFRREAKAAAGLHHTNIVPVFEVGRDGDVAFYAMQFIQGQGLDQVVDELRHFRGPDRNPVGDRRGELGQHLRIAPDSRQMGARSAVTNGRQLGPVAGSLLTGRLETDGPGSPAARTNAATGLVVTEPLGTDDSSDLRLWDHAEARPAADASSAAVLPGGASVSAIESSGRRQPFFRSVAQIGRQTSQGLSYAHARGIVHRDIKPSNLLLDTAGIVWITDFGLARADTDGLTTTGDIFGTLRYMAPERFRGQGDARADIYALGLTLYELLTLRPAFDSSDRLKLIEQIKSEEPPRPRAIDGRIPRDLETIVLKAIEKDPGLRYQSARAMAEDLSRFLADEPIQARRASAAEQYWRWARRNPLIAVMGGVLVGVLVLATVGSLLAAQRFRTQAETQHTLAVNEAEALRQTDQANASLRATQAELRQTVYATRSNLALAAWDAADVRRLRSLLDLLRPAPGQLDLRGWEWRYLWQLSHEERLILRAREDSFTDVVFSPDGKTIAGLEMTGQIQFWDRDSGKPWRTTGVTTKGRRADLSGGVGALAFSPDGRSLAGPGPDASLRLYDVETGLPTLTFEGPPGAVLSLAWSPDGRTLVAGISAHVLMVWDARDGHRLHKSFGAHNGPVASVAFSPDGRTLASASYDHTVKLWHPEDPVQPRAVLEGHSDEVRAVAFSPNGRRIASAGLDRTVRVWDAGSGAEVAVIRGHTGAVLSLAYLPGNAKVLTGSTDETVRVWDTVSGQELRTFKGHTVDVDAVAVSPDGRDFASASGDRTLRVWDAASPPRPRVLQSPSVLTYGGGVECLAFSPDGCRLVSGHDDNALRVWDLPSGRTLHIIKGHTKRILHVAFSPDGRTIASGGNDGTVRLWDGTTGGPRISFTVHTGAIGGLVFTPDGQTVLSGGSDRTIQAWDPATGAVRYVLRGHFEPVRDLTLSPDGRSLASVSDDKTCVLWDLPDQRPRLTLRGHTGRVNAVAFSHDGRTIATSSDDQTVRVWDAATGSPQGVLEGHIDRVDGLAFSPDGRLASSALDKTIRLWDPVSGQTLLVLKGHAGRIPRIRFSPDGRTLASASHDRTLKLWEAAPLAPTAVGAPGPAGP